MTKLHTCSESSKLGIKKDSQVISKVKPKVKIIHIYAPEIIKTDAENFRELVQRLTGKPEEDERSKSNKAMIMQEDVKNENGVKEDEDDIWRKSRSNDKFSGFLDGFSELDCFMEELSTFPLVNQN